MRIYSSSMTKKRIEMPESSIRSQNYSHDSKVWSKEYNLNGDLIKEIGEKDTIEKKFKYDNLDGYKYVERIL